MRSLIVKEETKSVRFEGAQRAIGEVFLFLWKSDTKRPLSSPLLGVPSRRTEGDSRFMT